MTANRTGQFGWWYLRVSGVLVVALVLGHLFVMHYAHAPSATGSRFVLERWMAAFWRGFDWTLLLLALTHGLAGMQSVVCDYIVTKRGRRASAVLLWVIGLAFASIGTFALVKAATGTGSIASASGGIAQGGPLSAVTWIPNVIDGLLAVLATATYLGIASLAVILSLRLIRRQSLGWWQFEGQWAFALHRASGIGILAFLLVHVIDLALLPLAPNLYDVTVKSYANPYLIPMEIALVAAVIYHALNGTWLVIAEFLDRRAVSPARTVFAGVLLATIVLVVPSIVVIARAL